MVHSTGQAVLDMVAKKLITVMVRHVFWGSWSPTNDDISHEQFGRDLKTFLFARAYTSEAPLRTSV